jgi:hypothetical protein
MVGGMNPAPQGGAGFNAYAAGAKVYGQGRSAPNVGPVSPNAKLGYAQRDAQNAARRAAFMQRAGTV